MLSHQEVELFGSIKRISWCNHVGRQVSLGMGCEVSKAHATPSQALDPDVVLSYSSRATNATMLPDMMIDSQ